MVNERRLTLQNSSSNLILSFSILKRKENLENLKANKVKKTQREFNKTLSKSLIFYSISNNNNLIKICKCNSDQCLCPFFTFTPMLITYFPFLSSPYWQLQSNHCFVWSSFYVMFFYVKRHLRWVLISKVLEPSY